VGTAHDQGFPNISMNNIQVSIKLFAVYQEIIGKPEITQSLPVGTSAGDVLQGLIDKYPQLDQWRSVTRLGVNLDFVEADRPLQDGDELVLIPPVSGG
jgi:sulfur-carrier protein